jgi:hypothetical protein
MSLPKPTVDHNAANHILRQAIAQSSMGGSNEPFLNKPARFPTISPTNAVRAGSDRELLTTLHQVLSAIETSEQAFDGLCVTVGLAIAHQTARDCFDRYSPVHSIAHHTSTQSNFFRIPGTIAAVWASSTGKGCGIGTSG